MPISKGLEWTFNTESEKYEKMRPGYVPELYRDIFKYIPIDISLARRIIRDYSDLEAEEIIDSVKNYISKGRAAYEEMLKTIKPNSDFVIDGTLSLDIILEKIEYAIKEI